VDLKFLVEEHSFSICDRRFGCIQQFFNTKEKIETPHEWETTLRNSRLNNVTTYWVNLDSIMNYKNFLRMKYISRGEDIEGEKFEVRKIAFSNFGSGEIIDQEEVHCAKSQIFGPEFARIRIGARRVDCNVLTYSITAESKYTWNIL